MRGVWLYGLIITANLRLSMSANINSEINGAIEILLLFPDTRCKIENQDLVLNYTGLYHIGKNCYSMMFRISSRGLAHCRYAKRLSPIFLFALRSMKIMKHFLYPWTCFALLGSHFLNETSKDFQIKNQAPSWGGNSRPSNE